MYPGVLASGLSFAEQETPASSSIPYMENPLSQQWKCVQRLWTRPPLCLRLFVTEMQEQGVRASTASGATYMASSKWHLIRMYLSLSEPRVFLAYSLYLLYVVLISTEGPVAP